MTTKKKNPCPPSPKGKTTTKPKNTGVTLDQMKEDMANEKSPALGRGKELVQQELAKRDIVYEDGEETLQCRLTHEEIERLEKQAVSLVGQVEDKKAVIKSTQSMLSSELNTLQSQLSNISRKAREGTEMRAVPTRTYMDYPRCTVYTVRRDTDETIRQRAMAGNELMMELSVGGKTFKDLSARPLEDTTTICE